MEKGKIPHKISVIVPCYNVEKYLEKCLLSLVNQSFKNYEIIVINDGSTDQSEKIMLDYVKRYPHLIRGYTKENGGLSSARNYGNTKSNSQYITYVDSDDYVDSDFLKKLYDATEGGKMDIVLSGRDKVSETGDILQILNYTPPTILRRLTTHGVLYKREYMLQQKILFPEGKIYEDNPYNLVMIFMTRNIKILEFVGYHQLVRNDSITAKKIDINKLPLEALNKSIAYISANRLQLDDFDNFEHTVISFLTYFIFQVNKSHLSKKNDRKSDVNVVLQICDWSQEIIRKYFCDCEKNSYISLRGNRELPLIQKLGTWLFVRLVKFHILKMFVRFYYLF